MTLNQLARRNLDEKKQSYHIGHMMMLRRQALGGQKPGTGDGSTARKIADETGSSESTVHRGSKFAEAIDAHSGGDAQKREELLSNDMSRKEIIYTAPKLCDRCKRVGAARDCTDCQLIRAGKKERGAETANQRTRIKPQPARDKSLKIVRSMKFVEKLALQLVMSKAGEKLRGIAASHGVPFSFETQVIDGKEVRVPQWKSINQLVALFAALSKERFDE